MWDAMSETEQIDWQIKLVCAELANVLAAVMRTPAPKGQQVTIHISRDRRDVWIEKPPEILHIRNG